MDHAAFGTNQEFVEQGAEQLDRRDPLKIGKCDVPLDFSLQQELHQQHAGEVRALQAELDCIVDSLDNFKCCVCFNVYDEGAHTPRSLSCGQDTLFDEEKHCCNSFRFHFLSRICFACNIYLPGTAYATLAPTSCSRTWQSLPSYVLPVACPFQLHTDPLSCLKILLSFPVPMLLVHC